MGRKVILVALAVTLCLSIFTPIAFAAVYGVVDTHNPDGVVNLRSEPYFDDDYNVIAKVRDGTKIEILELGEGWHKVKLVTNGTIGYMRDRYVRLIDETTSDDSNRPIVNEAIVKIGDVYHVSGESVNLRTGPGMSYNVIVVEKHNDKLMMLKWGKIWSRVQILGQKTTGYIKTAYITQGIKAKTTGNVNMRSKPGTEFRVIREIAEGTTLTIMKLGTKFSAVIINNAKGWVSTKFLDY